MEDSRRCVERTRGTAADGTRHPGLLAFLSITGRSLDTVTMMFSGVAVGAGVEFAVHGIVRFMRRARGLHGAPVRGQSRLATRRSAAAMSAAPSSTVISRWNSRVAPGSRYSRKSCLRFQARPRGEQLPGSTPVT